MTGLDRQAPPSPPGMANYEEAPQNEHLGEFIVRHKAMIGDDMPDMDGERINNYERVLRNTYMNDRFA